MSKISAGRRFGGIVLFGDGRSIGSKIKIYLLSTPISMNYLMLGLANLDFVVDVAILLDLVATQAILDYYHDDPMLDKLVYYSNPDFVAKYDISFW